MKTTIFFIMVLFPFVMKAQDLDIPYKEFAISFSDYKMELSPGESKQVEVRVLKSKGFQKNKVKMGMSSELPKGVTVTFDPEKGYFDISNAIISVQGGVVPGQYSLILNATVNFTTKGAILKLTIK
jgi:hypothetical protein